MHWVDACRESKQNIAIRVHKDHRNGKERTFIMKLNGHCITHRIDNVYPEVEAEPHHYMGFHDWMPAECLGVLITKDMIEEAREEYQESSNWRNLSVKSDPPSPPFKGWPYD
jgi:hypothetical protein